MTDSEQPRPQLYVLTLEKMMTTSGNTDKAVIRTFCGVATEERLRSDGGQLIQEGLDAIATGEDQSEIRDAVPATMDQVDGYVANRMMTEILESAVENIVQEIEEPEEHETEPEGKPH